MWHKITAVIAKQRHVDTKQKQQPILITDLKLNDESKVRQLVKFQYDKLYFGENQGLRNQCYSSTIYRLITDRKPTDNDIVINFLTTLIACRHANDSHKETWAFNQYTREKNTPLMAAINELPDDARIPLANTDSGLCGRTELESWLREGKSASDMGFKILKLHRHYKQYPDTLWVRTSPNYSDQKRLYKAMPEQAESTPLEFPSSFAVQLEQKTNHKNGKLKAHTIYVNVDDKNGKITIWENGWRDDVVLETDTDGSADDKFRIALECLFNQHAKNRPHWDHFRLKYYVTLPPDLRTIVHPTASRLKNVHAGILR